MTNPNAALLALADRCEREEPSELLDAAIARALGWTRELDEDDDRIVYWIDPDKHIRNRPDWSRSLDAAVRPEGWRVDVIRQDISGEWECALRNLRGDLAHAFASTEVMARRAAELRARAALMVQS